MNDFILATVSTADLEREWLDSRGIPFIPYTFSLDDRICEDDCREETRQAVWKAMREGKMPGTSQIPEFLYEEFFRSLLRSGKDVLFLDMARPMSASVANCEQAVRRVRQEFPEQRLHFLDTFCVSAGLGTLVMKLAEYKETGASLDEVIAMGEQLRRRVIHRFLCDDLQWLRRGGRLSNASAVVGTLLSIKPLLYVPDDGTLVAIEKIRGRKKAIRRLAESLQEEMDPSDPPKEIGIWHADCPEDADKLKEICLSLYPSLETVRIHTEGPVIGAHVGPGFLAAVQIGKGRIM